MSLQLIRNGYDIAFEVSGSKYVESSNKEIASSLMDFKKAGLF